MNSKIDTFEKSDNLDSGPFYHGTRADLKIGDSLTAGFKSNYRPAVTMNHIYFTALVNGAGLAAELSKGEGRERVYIVEPMKWGLVPMWSKEPTVKYNTFNARAEDLFEKPTWRGAARHHRCLIPATAFYEWVQQGTEKQPYYIHPIDQKYFAFAGIFDEWKQELLSYSIVTTTPNDETSKIHNRMPAILHPDDWDTWLAPSIQTRDDIEPLLRPYEDKKLELYKVSRDVNAVRHNDKSLLLPLSDQ